MLRFLRAGPVYECQVLGIHEKNNMQEILEKEMATHSSVLAWRIPRTGKPGGLLSMGSQSRT